MSVTKDCSKEESTKFTVGEDIYQDVGSVQSVDNEAPDNVMTGANISYQTVTCAAKTENTTNQIAENYNKGDVSCKWFICILVTITLVLSFHLFALLSYFTR